MKNLMQLFSALLLCMVLVTGCGGGGSGDDFFDPGPDPVSAPTIAAVAPDRGITEGDTEITVTGTGFAMVAGETTVLIDGVPATDVVVQSETALTCRTPEGTAGLASVAVSTPAGSDTRAGSFAYLGRYLFSVHSNVFFECYASSSSRVEIADLDTHALAGGFDLPGVGATSLAVSPDGSTVCVADSCGNRVLAYASDGTFLDEFPVTSPRDLVLSDDGATLYVSASLEILALDAATWTLAGSVGCDAGETPLGIALSPDGTTLAAGSTSSGGVVDQVVYLFSTSPLTRIERVTYTPDPSCNGFAMAVTFTDTGRVLAWSPDCDRVSQIDEASRTALTSEEIAYSVDLAASMISGSRIDYLPKSGLAYGVKESDEITISDPATASGVAEGGFAGKPLLMCPRSDGTGMYCVVLDSTTTPRTQTLDMLDAATGTWSRAVYTFSDTAAYVRDMHALRLPGL